MSVMKDHQLAFWRALLAPFHDHELSEVDGRGGKKFTYVDSRALMNRLDSVCGPLGWDITYRETGRGYIARMGILCPTDEIDAWVWHYKEDGGGHEGMTKKVAGENVEDTDNDEKSAFTNATRRVAQNAWGIARYLYRKGIPTFLDPNARPLTDPVAQPPAAPPDPATPSKAAQGGNGQQRPYDNFKIPPPGKPVFAWAKEMEKVFETRLTDGMAREGEERGWGRTFADWNKEQVNTIATAAIRFIRELPTYKGQFEHIFQAGGAPIPQGTSDQPGVNISDLRRDLANKLSALIARQTGVPKPNPSVLTQAFQNIAAECPNEHGHRGEVPESLKAMTDVVWLRNIIAFTENQIRLAATVPAAANTAGVEDDIPF
jgi:Rad52/22 family double-strand break repair protein